MVKMQWRGLAAVLVSAGLMNGPVSGIVSTYYLENPDAGDTFATAQVVTGGPYDGITGSIGGPDVRDFFFFGFAGGTFSWNFACDQCGTVTPAEAFLYDAQQTFLHSLYYGQSAGPINDMARGNYYLEIDTSGDDPPFTVTLTGPTTATSGLVGQPFNVPEPATLALLGLGLAGLGFSRRRQ